MASQSAVPAESARPPLLAACEAGELDEVVARLLDAGADINQPSVDAKTALMGAAMNGWPSVVELLLARGADKSLRNAWGETAHELAETMGGRIVADQGHAECARLLVA